MKDANQRRSSPRLRFACQARFRDAQAICAAVEQMCVTRDFSRDGLYFIADERGLREDMRLLMRFPDVLEAQEREYLVQIMRMKSLPDDRCGVGARLILRTVLGGIEALRVPKIDLSAYGAIYVPRQLVDLYA